MSNSDSRSSLAINNFVATAINGNHSTQQVFSDTIKFQKKLYNFNKHELGFLTDVKNDSIGLRKNRTLTPTVLRSATQTPTPQTWQNGIVSAGSVS